MGWHITSVNIPRQGVREGREGSTARASRGQRAGGDAGAGRTARGVGGHQNERLWVRAPLCTLFDVFLRRTLLADAASSVRPGLAVSTAVT
jgi:hypothetical protein